MAVQEREDNAKIPQVEVEDDVRKLASSFLGLSFSVMLTFLPDNAMSLVPQLTSEVKELRRRLGLAEEQLRQMKSRRVEDSKANARVVEIFASHRNSWQDEEKRLLQRIGAAEQEAFSLAERLNELEREREEFQRRIQELEREVGEREEMIGFMSRRGFEEEEGDGSDACGPGDSYGAPVAAYGANRSSNFTPSLVSTERFWTESSTNPYQDVPCEPFESVYHMKHFVPRRESPWKVDRDSAGASEKLRVLEDELLNLEKVCQSDLSKVPSLLRKQAKRYQALAGKIGDLCRGMQDNDPSDPTLSTEFRTQRQTEFLLEAFRLQQRASETGQKLVALQTEISKSNREDQLNPTKLTTRRSLELIKNNLKEVQRNLEIWLARIIGDLEGILARDGASHAFLWLVTKKEKLVLRAKGADLRALYQQ